MADILKIAVILGSLRRESYSRKTARALMALAPVSLELEIVEIGDLPLYNPDLEGAGPPAAWVAFRDRIRPADAILFVTPEYNRSVPGLLKNAIDVGSRPKPHNVWLGKPCGVIGVSPGAKGAFGANHHLRQSFVSLDMPVMQQPEAYIGDVEAMFDDRGALTDDRSREFLRKFAAAFERWVRRNRRSS